MATTKQVRAAKRNIQKAQRAALSKQTVAHLPEATRRDLGKQASKATAWRSDRSRAREQNALAKTRNIRGRSKMGKWDLIRALRA